MGYGGDVLNAMRDGCRRRRRRRYENGKDQCGDQARRHNQLRNAMRN
jgi:hypothetical protein